jgi:hypothetical protein
LRQQAELVTSHYTNVHQNMLGYAPTSESEASKLRLKYAAESGQNPALTYQPSMPAPIAKIKQIGFTGGRR